MFGQSQVRRKINEHKTFPEASRGVFMYFLKNNFLQKSWIFHRIKRKTKDLWKGIENQFNSSLHAKGAKGQREQIPGIKWIWVNNSAFPHHFPCLTFPAGVLELLGILIIVTPQWCLGWFTWGRRIVFFLCNYWHGLYLITLQDFLLFWRSSL